MARGAEKRHTLLIVDDEPDVLASLRSLFRRDYRVLVANRADEALEVLAAEPVQVVLSDQRMPGMTGAELLAIVGERFPDVMRLMMTGYSDINSVIEAINFGHVYRYISKPWDPTELQTVVRQACEKYDLLMEKRRLVRELEEANQLKTAFITVASHELNTPLTIVLGMLQLAQGRSDDSTLSDYIDRSLTAAERLYQRLTSTFKLLQENELKRPIERSHYPVRRWFEEVARDVQPFLDMRQQRLDTTVEPETLAARVAIPQARDVLLNLVTNAIKFSRDKAEIVLSASCADGRVHIEVTDHGVGISPEDQPYVFEPLFSTFDALHHSSGDYGYCKRGMGLGLAIAKRFVEMNGGVIGFRSEPGAGSTFFFELPASDGPDPIDPAPAAILGFDEDGKPLLSGDP